MRELGIYPVFPPSADYRVGDIRTIPLCEFDDRTSKYQGIGLLAGSIEPFLLTASSTDLAATPALSQTLVDRNTHRAAFPDYPQPASGASDAATTFVPATAPKSGSNELPLSQVAFPGFVNVTARGAEISALFPLAGLPVPMGASFTQNASANVNISVADSYSMPAGPLLKIFESHESSLLPSKLFLASQTDKRRPCSGKLVVTLINEVFYGRVFDVTLNEEAAAALSASIQRATLQTATLPVTAGVAAASGAASDAIAAATSAAASAASGVAVTLWTATSSSISLRRTYQQPIAVGYRGIRMIYSLGARGLQIDGITSSNDSNGAVRAAAPE